MSLIGVPCHTRGYGSWVGGSRKLSIYRMPLSLIKFGWMPPALNRMLIWICCNPFTFAGRLYLYSETYDGECKSRQPSYHD